LTDSRIDELTDFIGGFPFAFLLNLVDV